MSQRISSNLSNIESLKQGSKHVKSGLSEETIALVELLIGIIVFVVGFDFFLFHKPSHLIFEIGGIMLFASSFPIVHTMFRNVN
jgi:hypothetical protein